MDWFDFSLKLPITDPTWIFLLVLLIILFAPILLNKLRIPHIIGMILAGLVIGEHGFNILVRDSSFELFGKVVGFPGIHIKFCQKFAVPPVFQRIFPEVLPDIVLLELVVIGCQLRPDLRDLRLRVEVPEGHIQCFALQVGAVDTEIDVICPVFFPDICRFAVAVQRLAAAVSTL